MFKKLKSLFSKKDDNVLCGITLYVEKDGQIYVDVRMIDESDETIESLATMLSMYTPSSFFQVSSIIKIQLEKLLKFRSRAKKYFIYILISKI